MNDSRKLHEGVVARITSSADGGPIRRILNGRSRHPTGTYVSVKAGQRAMPWESHSCELSAMQLSEASTAVSSMLAQPHRLQLIVRGRKDALCYFPDLKIEVDEAVADNLAKGEPFGPTLLGAWPMSYSVERSRTVIVELKSDDDRRMKEPDYLLKLRMAKKVYRKLGMVFVIATEANDIRCANLDAAKQISLDRHALVHSVDVDRVVGFLESDSTSATLGSIREVLGGGHIGRAKAHALHVRRVIAIDLRTPLGPQSPVRLLRGTQTRDDRRH